MKKQPPPKPLSLKTHTLRALDSTRLELVDGGVTALSGRAYSCGVASCSAYCTQFLLAQVG